MTVLVKQTMSIANIWTKIFTTPGDGSIEVLGIRYVNNGADSVTVQFAITPTSAVPNLPLYSIQPPTVIAGYGGAEETNIGVMPDACVWVLANTANLSIYVTGVGG